MHSIIEFKDEDTAKIAIEKMHKFDLKTRKIIVREVSSQDFLVKLTLTDDNGYPRLEESEGHKFITSIRSQPTLLAKKIHLPIHSLC